MRNAVIQDRPEGLGDFFLMLPVILLCGLKFVAVPGLACVMVLPLFREQPELVWQAFLPLAFVAWVGGTCWGLWTVWEGTKGRF